MQPPAPGFEQRPCVVLADDDPLHSELVSMVLEHQGFDIICFGSGTSLVEWARQGEGISQVDALILDVEMPGLDGFATRAALAGDERFVSVPTLMVSGMCPEDLYDRARAEGVPAICKDADVLPRLAAWLSAEIGAGQS